MRRHVVHGQHQRPASGRQDGSRPALRRGDKAEAADTNIGKYPVTRRNHAGRWTVDHQPPNKLAPDGPWTGYPQCAACARQQGGIVRTILQEMYDFPPELSMGHS